MTIAKSDIIKQSFTIDAPLGPTEAADRQSAEGRALFVSYFDGDNVPIQQLRRNPSMIVGRRGSGKTDALLHLARDKRFTNRIYFNARDSARMFMTIINDVESTVSENSSPPFVEAVADLWGAIFWFTIIASIEFDFYSAKLIPNDDSIERKLTSEFVKAAGLPLNAETTPYDIALQAIVAIRKAYQASDYAASKIGLLEALPALQFGNYRLSRVRDAALNWLSSRSKQAVLLLDSIEAMDLNSVNNKIVISGLLKQMGSMEQPGLPVHMRTCIPAEVYFPLMDISSNLMKDFQRASILHWHPRELLRLAAKRFNIYLEHWSPESIREFSRPFNLNDRAGIIAYWNKLLPDTVYNLRTKAPERTIPYILRHTQLLPRQVLLVLNKIMSAQLHRSQGKIDRIDGDIITEQVRATEVLISRHVIESYSTIWPSAHNALEDIFPHLNGNTLEFGSLHHAYNNFSKRSYQKIIEFPDYVRMLSELGAIGRLVKEQSEYNVAVFEYSEPHKLLITSADHVCIHPAFSARYRVGAEAKDEVSYKPVYPYGTDPDSEDRRAAQYLLF